MKHSMRKQIFKNLFSNYFVSFLQMVMGVILIPFLIGKIGKQAFGVIVLAESTIAFFDLAMISIRIALSRHVTFSLGEKKYEEFEKYLSSGLGILFLVAVVVFTGGSVMSYFFDRIFTIPPQFAGQSRFLFFIITIAITATIPNVVYWSVLYSKQRFDLINGSLSTGIILRAVSIFVLFSILPAQYVSLVTYGFVYLAMKLTQNLMVYYFHFRVMPDISMRVRNFCWKHARDILSFGAHSSIARISGLLYNNVSQILINVFLGAGFNAVYAVSLKFPSLLRNLFLQGTFTLTPTFTDLAAKKDRERFESLFYTYSKIITIVTAPVCLVLIFMSHTIINLWVGRDFAMAGYLLQIQVFPLMFSFPTSVFGCIINAYARVKVPSYVTFCLGVLSVVLSLLFLKVFKWGLFSFALSAALSNILYTIVFFPWYSTRISGLHLKRFWQESLLRPIGWAMAVFCVIFGLIYHIQSGFQLSWMLAAFLSGACLIYMYGAFHLLLVDKEKDFVNELLFKKIRVMWEKAGKEWEQEK